MRSPDLFDLDQNWAKYCIAGDSKQNTYWSSSHCWDSLKGLPQLLIYGPRNRLRAIPLSFRCDEGQMLDPHGVGMTKLHPNTNVFNNLIFKLMKCFQKSRQPT